MSSPPVLRHLSGRTSGGPDPGRRGRDPHRRRKQSDSLHAAVGSGQVFESLEVAATHDAFELARFGRIHGGLELLGGQGTPQGLKIVKQTGLPGSAAGVGSRPMTRGERSSTTLAVAILPPIIAFWNHRAIQIQRICQVWIERVP